MPKYSIIIPIYNAADRITKVLDSVTSQIYKSYELILVLDSCTDHTKKIIKNTYIQPGTIPRSTDFQLEKSVGNVEVYRNGLTSIVIAEVNYGNDGPTRSKGLDLATGDWVLFLDDDDWWLDNNILDIIEMSTIQASEKDIIQFGFIWRGQGYCSCHMKNTFPEKFTNSSEEGLWANVWSKCIKRSFIGDTRFPEVHSVSDLEFMNALMVKKPKVAFCEYPIYYYNWLRVGSISETDRRETTKEDNTSSELSWEM